MINTWRKETRDRQKLGYRCCEDEDSAFIKGETDIGRFNFGNYVGPDNLQRLYRRLFWNGVDPFACL